MSSCILVHILNAQKRFLFIVPLPIGNAKLFHIQSVHFAYILIEIYD